MQTPQQMAAISISAKSGLFLSAEERKALTGTCRRTGQIQWLVDNGWKFVIDFKGQPVVAKAEVERQLVSLDPVKAQSSPNWDAVR